MLTRLILSIVLVAAAAFLSTPALAVTVTLDGVANATWSANPRTYLYVWNQSTDISYVHWNYGDKDPLPWTSLTQMAADLSDPSKYVDWHVESGGNPFSLSSSVFQTLTLPAGVYSLRLAQDSLAYNLQGFQWPGEKTHQDVWNAYVEIYAVYPDGTGRSFSFGGFNSFQDTDAALAFYRQHVDGMQMVLDDPAAVNFYINDYNSLDNTMSVSLEINQVPIPGTLPLLGSGLVVLLAARRRRWGRKDLS